MHAGIADLTAYIMDETKTVFLVFSKH